MTKEDFVNWKHHVVTQQIFSNLQARVDYLIEEVIAQTPYMSQSEMAEKTGAIRALRDVLSVTFEEAHGN